MSEHPTTRPLARQVHSRVGEPLCLKMGRRRRHAAVAASASQLRRHKSCQSCSCTICGQEQGRQGHGCKRRHPRSVCALRDGLLCVSVCVPTGLSLAFSIFLRDRCLSATLSEGAVRNRPALTTSLFTARLTTTHPVANKSTIRDPPPIGGRRGSPPRFPDPPLEVAQF